jgi:uncharacterized lipoprotein YbaY
VILAVLVWLIANTAAAQTITGTATYRERLTLPPAAVFVVALEDVSRADAAAETIARSRFAAFGTPPIAFTISYDPARIRPDHTYSVRAWIVLDDRMLFTTDTAVPVLTRGNPAKVSILLRRVGAGQATAQEPESGSPLAGTSWQLVIFQGSDGTTLTPDDRAKYTIEFDADNQLIVRIDCNRGRGTWTSSGPGQLQFGPLALTRAQCPPGSLHDQMVRQWGYVRSYVVRDGYLFLALMADGGIYAFEPVSKSTP